jgi:hypothetical protein
MEQVKCGVAAILALAALGLVVVTYHSSSANVLVQVLATPTRMWTEPQGYTAVIGQGSVSARRDCDVMVWMNPCFGGCACIRFRNH